MENTSKKYKYVIFTMIGEKYMFISGVEPSLLIEELEHEQYLCSGKSGIILPKDQIEHIEFEEIDDEKGAK